MVGRFKLVLAVMLLALASALAISVPAHAALGLRETADVEPWMTNGIVYASALSEDGNTLYIGGKFTQVRSTPPGTPGQSFSVGRVAAIDVQSGTPIRTFTPSVTSNDGTAPVVRSLALSENEETLYIGGKFTTVGGQAHRNLAAVDANTGAVQGSFTPTVGDSSSTVFALAADSSRLYVGGTFASVNGAGRANLVALNPSTGATDNNWKARANRVVRSFAFGQNQDGTPDGTIFVAGGFKSISYPGDASSPYARQSVVRLDAATGSVHPWSVPAGQIQTDSSRNNNMTCWDATVWPGTSSVGSRLILDCGLGPNYTAAYRLDNGNSGDRIWSRGFGGNPQSTAISPDGSRLIVGGHFGINPIKQQVCGKPLGGLVALDPANGAIDCSSGWVPHLDQNKDPSYDGAWTVLSTDRHVWVGGGFVGVSGQPRTNLARFTYDPNFKAINYAKPKVDLNGPETSNGPRRGGLDAVYFDNMDFTGPQVSRVDPTINFDWGEGQPDPSIGSDTFSARWTGQVEAPVSGEYTFTTNTDDGVRLFVDGQQIVDAWRDRGPTDDSGTITLEAGRRYDIRMDYYENGIGAVARLHWSYPGQARQVVPSNSLIYSGSTGGLDAVYFDNRDFTGPQVSRVDPTINFDFGGGSPDPSIGPDEFSARWTGQVEAPVSGEYTFITTADDGVRLFVDGRQIVDNWSDRAPTDDSGTITLEAGRRYDIQMDYYENGGGAVARLQWAYPGQTRQVVPSTSLLNLGDTDYAANFTAGPTSIVDGGRLLVFDADDVNIRSATVKLQSRPDGTAERLLADTSGTAVTQNFDAATGTLSLNGSASKAAYERILRSVRYDNTAASPTPGDRSVTFVVNDGFDNSAPATSTVTVQGP